VTERTGAVYDLGYVPYDGERSGRRGAVLATIRDGLQRVMGIKRRARRKILPWILTTMAILPAVVFVGFSYLTSNFTPEAESPFGSHVEYFNLVGGVVFLFIALAAPEMLVPDRKDGVLAIYSSRPMRADDYVWARAAGLALVLLGFLLIPHALMYVGFAGLAPDGIASALVDNAGDLPKILLTSLVYVAGYAPIALLIAAFTARKSVAAGIFIVGMPMLAGIGNSLVESTDVPGHRFGALLALAEHPAHVRDWIFGRASNEIAMARAGFDPWLSLAIIVVVAVVSLAIIVIRYRRLM
jgi:ABC-2 type transport system permease protein